MAIATDTTETALKKFFVLCSEILREEILRAFAYLGEQCVNAARLPHDNNWNDITGNLRSSIGYAVYEEGKTQIQSAFDLVKNGTQGQTEGKRMVEELAGKYADTYALVVLAGMDYASYVESKDNRDVLASASLKASSKMQEYMNKAVERAVARINKLQI